MSLKRSFQLFRWFLLVIIATMIAGCGGSGPRDRAPASAKVRVVLVEFGGSAYAQERSRALAALLGPEDGISVEYVTAGRAGDVDSEERAAAVGRASRAAVVVWAKWEEGGAAADVQMTFLSAGGGPRTFNVPVETAELNPGASPASQQAPPAG